MVVNGSYLCAVCPVTPYHAEKLKHYSGTSYGQGEAGYDITIKQEIRFTESKVYVAGEEHSGHFCLASSIEEFHMPTDLVAIVHDKSTWARQGLSVFNTVIEPGWTGFLTLELVYHGKSNLLIPAGSGIAQVVFHKLWQDARYNGKYQGQPDRPVESIFEGVNPHE